MTWLGVDAQFGFVFDALRGGAFRSKLWHRLDRRKLREKYLVEDAVEASFLGEKRFI